MTSVISFTGNVDAAISGFLCETVQQVQVVFAKMGHLMNWWARHPVTDAPEEAEVTEATACQVYQWLREVCLTKLINTPICFWRPSK